MPVVKNKVLRRGVVYTPDKVAASVCKFLLHGQDTPMSVLEPSAGDGVFITKLIELGVPANVITAIDISKVSSKKLSLDYPNSEIITQDFISFVQNQADRRYDLIVGNPPYVRRHNYTKQQYKSLSILSETLKYPLSSIKNAWAGFVLASCNLLSEDGTLAFLIPYEFLTVSYGKNLQNWLLKELHRLDVYIPKTKAFPDIDQDAVLLIGSKKTSQEKGFFIHHIESLSDISRQHPKKVAVRNGKLCQIDQNKFLLGDKAAKLLVKLEKDLKPISDFCESATGTVTAANDFFIISKKEIEEKKLHKWAEPILKKASFLPNSIYFSAHDFKTLSDDEPCFLINFGDNELADLDLDAAKYIALGESKGYQNRYKCSHRKPWYRIPTTPKADAYFFKRSHLVPRLTINDAGIQATDTAYRLSMKQGYDVPSFCFSFYNSLTLLFGEIYGRFYGGGVLELTPNEFKKLPICYVEPSELEFNSFETALSQHLKNPTKVFSFGDQWLQERLQLSSSDILLLQEALISVRNHRIRHSSSKMRVPS